MYRMMLNIKRSDRVSNATLYDLTRPVSLVKNARTRQLRLLGHVPRMPDDEPCKGVCTVYSITWEEETRKATNPLSQLHSTPIGDTDNMIGPDKLSELAQDCCGWRMLVVTCSAADR